MVENDEREMDVYTVWRVANGFFMSHRKLRENILFNENAFPFLEGNISPW